MHELTFLQDLAVVMIVAGLVTILFHRFKQPVVLGYILAGFIIGPHTPPVSLITSEISINTLAEIGVILLMFSLGLEFSLRKLKKVGGTAVIAASLEILGMGWVGYELGKLFGWSNTDSLFLGAMLSMSSTTVIIKVLTEMGRNEGQISAQLIFGILIIEDILGIAMIALLSGIAMTGTLSVGTVGVTLGKLGIFLVVVLVVGLLAVPRLLGYVAKFKSNEMLLITVLGFCFGVSLLAAKLGYSVALGAFVIGAVIAEAREIHRIETLIEPVRDMFSAVFFVAIGLLIDPQMLLTHWLPVLVITLAVIVCKVIACASGTFLGGYDRGTSLRVGMSVAQIGEFSFIIASLGVTLNVTSKFLYPIAVAVSALTTLSTPYLIRSSDGVVNLFDRIAPRWLVDTLTLYSHWVQRLGGVQPENQARQLSRRWVLQMALNVALASGVFLAGAAVADRVKEWWPDVPGWLGGAKGLLWIGTGLVALPALIAVIRKLEAFALLLAEVSVPNAIAGKNSGTVRNVIANVIRLAGTVLLGLWVLLISAPFLPPWPWLLVPLSIIGLLTVVFWRRFIQIHSKAQIALRETLAQPPALASENRQPLATILKDAQLEPVLIVTGLSGAGRLIRELELRTQTGASIVAIERAGTSLINPGPDEEVRAGDRVFLLGTNEQTAQAKLRLEAVP